MPIPSTDSVFSIFKQLNNIPRPSHHEERVADFLCAFAQEHHLSYERDEQNCVVIRKPASPGHEHAEPIVILNHMDMVCVGMNNPLIDSIEAYVDNGWMKARGTSLGADNGIGLSMALAVLADDTIEHGPLEVLTTTNEEDGMSGAANLSPHFIRGRKVINLDSEDFDTITTGAAGAYLQLHRIPLTRQEPPSGKHRWYRVTISGGLGGHSGVDINKHRASATVLTWALLAAIYNDYDFDIASIRVGEANASIASSAELILCVPSGETCEFVKAQEQSLNEWIKQEFGTTDPGISCKIEKCDKQDTVICREAWESLLAALEQVPQGVVKMSETLPDTVETSNNVGRILTETDHLLVSTHTRSFIDADMIALGQDIASAFAEAGATSQLIMSAPAWQEDCHSAFLSLTSDTFNDVLGWRPRPVAMHFVLEAGYLVQKYPGIQIASIGPRILEPHSTSERVNLQSIEDIWKVFIQLLKNIA